MAITRIRSTGKAQVSNATSLAFNFAALPAVGNFVVVQMAGWDLFSPELMDFAAGAVTDNQGNTYTRAVQSAVGTGDIRTAIFFTEVATSAGTYTVTINPGGANWMGFAVATEWSGIADSSPLDCILTATGSSTTPNPGTTDAIAQNDELIVTVFGINSQQASIAVESVSPAWTQEAEELSRDDYAPGEADSKIVTAGGEQTANWTCATTGAWSASIATFKAVSLNQYWCGVTGRS